MTENRFYKDTNLQIIFSISLLAVLGITSVTPAFPTIVEQLGISRTSVGLLITAFSVPSMILTPFLGTLADRLGRKRILVPALFLYGVAGGACALSRDFNTLLVLRVLQGVGAAATAPLSWTILGDLYAGKQRIHVMGLNSTVISITSAIYPLIGGALAMVAWNYPFLLSLIAIPIGFASMRYLRNPEPKISQSFREYLGGAWGYFKNIYVISAFIGGLIIFLIVYGAYQNYLSLYLGAFFSASPFLIGLLLSSTAVGTAVVASRLGWITGFIPGTGLIKLGLILFAISMALYPFMPEPVFILIPAVIFGVGYGIIAPTLQNYVAGASPDEYRAVFMSINMTMFRAGQALGPVLFGVAYALADFNGVFFSAAGAALIAAIVGVVGGKLIRKQKPPEPVNLPTPLP